MPKPIGLRATYHQHVERISPNFTKNGKPQVLQAEGEGWYIETKTAGKWRCLLGLGLNFAREKDALRGIEMLTMAGLNSPQKLREADPHLIKQLACGFLQW